MNNLKTSGFLHLALLGAVVATLCDANHVYTLTPGYPVPFLAGQAWWVFPGFFLAFLFMGVASAWLADQCRAVMPVTTSQSSVWRSILAWRTLYARRACAEGKPAILRLSLGF